MELMFCIEDEDVLRELEQYDEGKERQEVAYAALRIGIQSFRYARGEVDRQAVQRVAEKMLSDISDCVSEKLTGHENSILEQFSLDVSGSAVSRLSKTLDDKLEGHHIKLDGSLEFLRLRSNRTLVRGDGDFEPEAGRLLGTFAQAANDCFSETGTMAGALLGARSGVNKTGDFVITLGSECAAAGEKIVVETKRDSSYNLDKVLKEAKEARENRNAQVCIFVLDQQYGKKSNMPPLRFLDHTVVILWSQEQPETNVYLETAYWLARCMVMPHPKDERVAKAQEKALADSLGQIAALSETLEGVERGADKIAKEAALLKASAANVKNILQAHVEVLRDQLLQMQKVLQAVQTKPSTPLLDPQLCDGLEETDSHASPQSA